MLYNKSLTVVRSFVGVPFVNISVCSNTLNPIKPIKSKSIKPITNQNKPKNKLNSINQSMLFKRVLINSIALMV